MTKNTSHDIQPIQPDNGKAIASMILGLISLTGFGFILGIPAIILGAIALKKKQGEKAFSITGIVSGAVSTLISIVVLALIAMLLVLSIGVSSTVNERHFHPMDNNTMYMQRAERT